MIPVNCKIYRYLSVSDDIREVENIDIYLYQMKFVKGKISISISDDIFEVEDWYLRR